MGLSETQPKVTKVDGLGCHSELNIVVPLTRFGIVGYSWTIVGQLTNKRSIKKSLGQGSVLV